MTREQRRVLLYAAERYASLGYSVGLTQEKALVAEYHPRNPFASARSQSVHVPKDKDWEGISIILKGMVCVDFDVETVKCADPLPKTWEERTSRGWHYFYRLPPKGRFYSQVAYREGLDLLTKDASKRVQARYPARRRRRGQPEDTKLYGHALVSPTPGYWLSRPFMPFNKLPMAPKWVLIALKEG